MKTTNGKSDPPQYQDLVDYVRRFDIGTLLRTLAARNAELTAEQFNPSKTQRVSVRSPRAQAHKQTFVLGGLARTALISGAKHRQHGPTEKDVIKMAHIYMAVDAPDLSSSTDENPAPLLRVLGRFTYEQFSAQQSMFEHLGRTGSLLVDHADRHDEFPTPGDWETKLGCSLEHFIRIGFVLHLLAYNRGGAFTRDFLSGPTCAPLWDPVGTQATMDVIERWFVTTPDEARTLGAAQELPPYEKWSYNPLVGHPLIEVGDQLLAPWPWMLLHRVTPTGLYHIGIELFGGGFPGALGHVFEAYVGTQLELLDATVIPEIIFKDGKDEKRTVDYFVVLPDLVLLVEVKAARPTADGRAGASNLGEEDIAKKINWAFDQIQRSADMVTEGHEAVKNIPADRKLAALVVTLEPFNLLNTDLADGILTRPNIPTAVVSAHELESVVATLAAHPDAGARIFAALTPSGEGVPPSLYTAAEDLDQVSNPILETIWDRFYEPWLQATNRATARSSGDDPTAAK